MAFVFMVQMEKDTKKQLWWMPAMVIFSRMSFYIAFPIIIGLFVGKKLDDRFGTEPLLFIVLMGVAFMISIVSIVKISKKYIKDIEIEAEKNRLNKEKDVNPNK